MSYGTSIVLIAVGAILKYAVTFSVSGVELETVGTILLVVGIIGLVISLLYTFVLSDRSRRGGPGAGPPADRTPRDGYVDPYDAPTRNRSRY